MDLNQRRQRPRPVMNLLAPLCAQAHALQHLPLVVVFGAGSASWRVFRAVDVDVIVHQEADPAGGDLEAASEHP